MKHAAIVRRFEEYLRGNSSKLTPQRQRIFDRVFATHDHFSAETLYQWLRAEDGPRVSRATVYRTLELLEKGGFVESLDAGQGELMYEHVMGHHHHDHMVCNSCGRIEEFHDARIEELQEQAAAKIGFQIESHVHRLSGLCKSCARERRTKRARRGAGARRAGE